jgi:Fibronectin type III domain
MGLTWQTWTSVSQGSTTPGAPVAAIPWDDSFALFLSDPNGGVYAIKAIPGYGWEAVPGRSSKPGGQIAVVPWYRPPAASSSTFAQPQFLLFMVDVNGQVSFSSGRPYQGWDAWASVPGSSSVPGAPVTTLPQLSGSSPFTLFMADSRGEVDATRTSGPPATPHLVVKSVTSQTIDVSWSESNPAPVELDGFELSITQWRIEGREGEVIVSTGSAIKGPNIRSMSFDLEGEIYTIKIRAFSANGYSPDSTVTGRSS